MTSSGAIFQRVKKGKGKGKREREIEFRWRKNVERIPYKNQHSGGGCDCQSLWAPASIRAVVEKKLQES